MSENQLPVLSVSDVNRYAAKLLENDALLHNLTVRGEISGFKRHTSGHLYFTLKDDAAAIKCVMFKGQAYSLIFRPEDGMRVTVNGYVSLYQRDGSFQLYVLSMEKDGVGDLFARFMEMKALYASKGYFDAACKKEIPFLPRAVGVVTSGSGAALHDITQIIGRRFPSMPIILCPVKVQGPGSADDIARGIQMLDRSKRCDVIIVGRGGGSVEDLWAFNEVPVIEAIHACSTPIISAVGHETDFSVADFVADMRAPTPSAAAELSVPSLDAVLLGLDGQLERLTRAANSFVDIRRAKLEVLKGRASVEALRHRISTERNSLRIKRDRIEHSTASRLLAARNATDKLRSSLIAMNPERVLERGYAIVFDDAHNVVSDVHNIEKGSTLQVLLNNGSVDTIVTRIHPKEN